ncbi:MAG: sulfur reduction protein DsrJ [Chromatiaceae bacterium]|nr:sulfur reduction protein DsrJ [Chromatiaceae bacterium]
MAKALPRASLVAMALAWTLGVQAVAADEQKMRSYVVEGSRAATLDACVEPTNEMRRKHMEFIKHQRIATVHEGIRSTPYSLAGCVECHVSQDAGGQGAIPIDRPDQFCGACHAYAAVDLNCFDCHSALPEGSSEAAAAAHRAAGLAQSPAERAEGAGH